MAAVAEESGNIDVSRTRPVDAVKKGYVRFREADMIFAKITPCMENGKTAPALGIPGGYAAGSTEFHVLRPRCVDTKYLWYWVLRRAFRQDAERNMSGSAGQLRVPVDYLRNAPIPVAPLLEQKRIVARIDELFAEIAEGDAALERARSDLDTWRRALLKAAVTGELTRDWREENRPVETGADLLARVRRGREGSPSPSQPRGRSPPANAFDGAALPGLPYGWAWAPFAALVDTLRNGTAVVPVKRETNCPILRIAAVRPLAVDCKDIRFLEENSAATVAEFQVRTGDLLLTRYNGSRRLVGVCGIFKGEQPVYYPDKLIRVRLSPVAVELSPFFEAAINSAVSRKFIDGEIKTTAGQHGISGSSLLRAPVPVPPPAEAMVIINRLFEALAIETDGRREIRAAHQLSQAQRQSILKAAFEGRLVPQDPADEPASALLARLRQSTEAQTRSHRRGRQLRLAV
jgi:type I restriction enzyme S subunit